AEDGIRDDLVTGVQTCALPILAGRRGRDPVAGGSTVRSGRRGGVRRCRTRSARHLPGVSRDMSAFPTAPAAADRALDPADPFAEIGRASCRESVWTHGVGVLVR